MAAGRGAHPDSNTGLWSGLVATGVAAVVQAERLARGADLARVHWPARTTAAAVAAAAGAGFRRVGGGASGLRFGDAGSAASCIQPEDSSVHTQRNSHSAGAAHQ